MKKTRYMIPYGYGVENGEVVVIDFEAKVVEYMFSEYAKGQSLKAIADALNGQEIPYTEEKCSWNKSRVARMLDNEKYIGKDGFPAIIETELFTLVHEQRERKHIEVTRDNSKLLHAIKKRIRCSLCGEKTRFSRLPKQPRQLCIRCSVKECGFETIVEEEWLIKTTVEVIARAIQNIDTLKVDTVSFNSVAFNFEGLKNELKDEIIKEQPNPKLVYDRLAIIATKLYKAVSINEDVMAKILCEKLTRLSQREDFSIEKLEIMTESIMVAMKSVEIRTKFGQTISGG